ncbi:MAG TPA: triose-phosphate isomerase [Sphingomicrobium sp.]|nr:triose-phosphate isomerase [Sphingomicrobium sp.]
MAIRPLIAGNWKMHGRKTSLAELATIRDRVAAGETGGTEIVVCPPATLIAAAVETARGAVGIGGQDCHTNPEGAHTGDISAEMLADLGASYVILGHSERRTDHGETNPLVRAKVQAVWRAGLSAIVCIGETLAERNEGQTIEVVSWQLRESLPEGGRPSNLAIAYEPVWAIGSGLTPSPGDVAAVHGSIRDNLIRRHGPEAAGIRILYGGSVKPDNAATLLTAENVNGALVGGASLKASDFLAIAKVYS